MNDTLTQGRGQVNKKAERNLGLGVMIHMLGGNEESAATFQGAVGKTIASLKIEPEWGDGGALVFRFTDGTAIQLRDEGQSCCEHRYLHTDDKLDDFVGTQLLDAELRDALSLPEEWGKHEVQFLVVKTSIGEFTVETHNEHNGYYGGFWVVAMPVEEGPGGQAEV